MEKLIAILSRWRRARRLRLHPERRTWHEHVGPRHGIVMRRLLPSGDYEYRRMTETEAHEAAKRDVW